MYWVKKHAFLHVEGALGDILLVALVHPLKVPVMGVICACQQPPHLQRKTRPKLLQTHPTPILTKHVSVLAEEYEVALVVKGNHLTPLELGFMWKKGTQETAETTT